MLSVFLCVLRFGVFGRCGVITVFAIETSSGSRNGVFSESNNQTGNKVDCGILKKSGPVVVAAFSVSVSGC